MKCPLCDSTEIIEGLTLVDRGSNNNKHDLEIEIPTNPKALVLKRGVSAKLWGSVCGSCGHVMLSIQRDQLSLIRDAAAALKVTENYGDIRKHPMFREFVEEDSARKHFNPDDQASHFAAWMRNRDPGP